MSNLNSVEATVSVAGSKVKFAELSLNQSFNNHQRCTILVDYDAFGDKSWMENPVKLIKMIGEALTINFYHVQTGESETFSGLVSNVSFVGNHGVNNHVLIEGVSETIKLAGQPHMDSFVDKTLEQIVSGAVGASGNGAKVTVQPEYAKPINFVMQYNESCFDFLNRLSSLYGEAFYYNGKEIIWGKPNLDASVTIKYDIEMTHFNIRASLLPPRFKHFNYLQHHHEEKFKETRKDAPDATGYLRPALDKSEMIYTSEVTSPVGASVHDPDSLLKMIDIERTRTVAEMLVLGGSTQTCKVGIGKVITITFPEEFNINTSPGEFVVTDITHTIDQTGHYSNTFSGVRAGLGYIPVPAMPLPITSSQRATVLSNADPEGKGRIKVQTQWQKYVNKNTNWIRVQTPDAGSSSVFPKDRGYIFIPEEGDEVMIQFEDNDTSRPYCSGSLFPETKSRGGEELNHLKSIKTRSGHMIEFNDSENAETIKIRDINANEILYDTRSKTITISTLEKINLVSKTICIDASEDLIISVGRDMQQSVGNNYTEATSGESRISVGKSSVTTIENDYEVSAKRNIEIESGKNTTMLVGAKLRQDVQSNIDITAVGGKTNISSKGKIEIKSNDKVNIK